MNSRPTAHRTTLLLGTAFLTGLTIGPAAGLMAGISVVSGGNAAFAQDSDRATPTGCSRCLATCSSRCTWNTSIRSPTRL